MIRQIFFFFVLALWSNLVGASFNTKTSYYVADESLDHVLQAYQFGEFKAFKGVLSLGYQALPTWVILEVSGVTPGQSYFLSSRPIFLENLDFYELKNSKNSNLNFELLHPTSGQSSNDHFITRDRDSVVVRPSSEKVTYLLRIQTSTILLTQFELQEKIDYLREQGNFSAQIGFFFGMSLTLFVLVIFIGVGVTSQFYGLFIAFEFVLATLVLSMSHVFAPLWDALGLKLVLGFRLFFPFTMICMAVFNIALLRFFKAPSKAISAQTALFIVYLLLFLLQVILGATTFSRLTVAFLSLSCLISTLTLVSMRFKHLYYKFFIIFIYVCLLYLSIVAIGSTWLRWPTGPWIFNWPMWVITCLSLLIFFTVTYELILLRNERQETKTLLALEQQKNELEALTNAQNGKLLSMLSHEFKNSLAIINMEISVLREQGLELKHSSKAIEDLLSIIERCMLLDKAAQRLLHTQIESVDCVGLVNELIRYKVSSPQIFTVGLNQARVMTDESILRIIIANLLDNACKYGAKGQAIRIEFDCLDSQQDFIKIKISNQVGVCGKPDCRQVFTKYYRSAAVMNFSGSGLGLYLVNTLVGLVNGDIQYLDEVDWISFELSLPKATFS